MDEETTAKITIGGTTTTLSPMMFDQLKLILPFVLISSGGHNRIEITDAALSICAIMISDVDHRTAEDIQAQALLLGQKLFATEIDGLLRSITKLLTVSGLVAAGDPAPGEPVAIG